MSDVISAGSESWSESGSDWDSCPSSSMSAKLGCPFSISGTEDIAKPRVRTRISKIRVLVELRDGCCCVEMLW